MLAGCGLRAEEEAVPVAAEQGRTIGVVVKAMDSEYWLAVRAGMQRAARELNLQLVILAPRDEYAQDQQQQMIEDILKNNIDGIIVSPVNIKQADGIIDMVQKKGVPLLTMDEKLPGVTYVGSNNAAMGRMAAERMARVLPSGSHVAVVGCNGQQYAHVERVRGFCEYLQNSTDLKLSFSIFGEVDSSRLVSREQALLREHPEVMGVYVTNAYMTLQTLGIADSLGRNYKIIGIDTQSDVLLALRQGKLDSVISQEGNKIGYEAVQQMYEFLQQGSGQPRDDRFMVNTLITSENADAYANNGEVQ